MDETMPEDKPESLIACDGCGVMQRPADLTHVRWLCFGDFIKESYYCDDCARKVEEIYGRFKVIK
jgi:hypothetical protein